MMSKHRKDSKMAGKFWGGMFSGGESDEPPTPKWTEETRKQIVDAVAALDEEQKPGADIVAAAEEKPEPELVIDETLGVEKVESDLDAVKIDLEFFQSGAIALFHLPGFKVMDAMTTPEPMKMGKLIELLILALPQNKAEELNALNFSELGAVLGEWIDQSTPDDMKPGHGRGGYA